MTPRPAAFLDRDGTINVDTNHVSRVEDVRLIPGAAAAIRRLNDADVPVIVVTNQGGIARGYFTEDDYARVRDRVAELLAAEGARVTAQYHCPHHPLVTGPCECRKPGTRHHREAAARFGLDVARSLYVGDRLTDIEPAAPLAGFGLLVPQPHTTPADLAAATRAFGVAADLGDAVARFLARYGLEG